MEEAQARSAAACAAEMGARDELVGELAAQLEASEAAEKAALAKAARTARLLDSALGSVKALVGEIQASTLSFLGAPASLFSGDRIRAPRPLFFSPSSFFPGRATKRL